MTISPNNPWQRPVVAGYIIVMSLLIVTIPFHPLWLLLTALGGCGVLAFIARRWLRWFHYPPNEGDLK
jgi:hypothetical protein